MDIITEKITEAIEDIQSEICEVYGAPETSEDAAKINEELSNFVQEVAERALEPVREAIRRLLTSPPGPAGPTPSPAPGPTNTIDIAKKLASLEAKLDCLLNRTPGHLAEKPGTQPIMIKQQNGQNPWARYQGAWVKYKCNVGQSIPIHPGERSKLCALEYKQFKLKTSEEKEAFLAEYSA